MSEQSNALPPERQAEVRRIRQRLSLRPPQAESLALLARLTELLPLRKPLADGFQPPAAGEAARVLAQARVDVQAAVPVAVGFEAFERDFLSLAFALATGVGKTRLMGAFITYLHAAHGVKHFMLIAPNLTIYDKLKEDFRPGSEKYVFRGIGEFHQQPPLVIDGDNYTSSAATRGGKGQLAVYSGDQVHINIFNVSKLNKEAKPSKGAAPRIKRLSEYIGQSYFDYLAGLDDLVVLMDESHRYRADAAVTMLNELSPVLGLELTATPKVVKGKTERPFKNVVYRYNLANAIHDGFVKDPSVAGREDFDPGRFSESELERLKLRDGVRLHEHTKTHLDTYARNSGRPRVKPFMLVVAANTDHAEELVAFMETEEFFDGRYRGKVITVHSNQKKSVSDDVIQRLMAVERPDEPTEIVVHVDKLKEGWDVRNLYTIVPLRAANSPVLVEQSIGRGLRLPYGERTGNAEVDRLTVVSHDNFNRIVESANQADSVFRSFVRIGAEVPENGSVVQRQRNRSEVALFGAEPAGGDAEGQQESTFAPFGKAEDAAPEPLLRTRRAQDIGRVAQDVLTKYIESASAKTLPSPDALAENEHQAALVQQVRTQLHTGQLDLGMVAEGEQDIDEIVALVTEQKREHLIAVPRVVVVPQGEVEISYAPFELDTSRLNMEPGSQRVVGQALQSGERYTVEVGAATVAEQRLEDYVVRKLIDFHDIDYQTHADLLYALAGDVVAHFRERFGGDDEQVRDVLAQFDGVIAENVHAQMVAHRSETAAGYEAQVSQGFQDIKSSAYTRSADEPAYHYERTDIPKERIRQVLWTGFRKSLQDVQKFDSDTERQVAALLERDDVVVRWFRPAKDQLKIYFRGGRSYEPDFVVETQQRKYLLEIKRRSELDAAGVLEKQAAAEVWCAAATEYEAANGGKGWVYRLVPHDTVRADVSWRGLVG